jgi:hypothetical protein
MVTQVKAPPTASSFPPFRAVHNGKLTLNLNPAQTLAWDAKETWIFLLVGTQGGKTVFGPHWLEREIRNQGSLGDFLAVTATYPLLRLKMLPEFRLVFESLFNLGIWKESDKVFISHEKYHGAEAFRVIFGSATNPESIESATAKAAWLDEMGQEQFKRGAWEAVLRRLSIAEGRILGTSTPYGWGWLKTEVYDKARAGDTTIKVIQADSTINPAFPKSEFDKAKARLPRWRFNLFYRALFEKPAGLIYDAFDEQVCRVPRFNLNKEWPRYVGHDFGPNNTAALWYAQDPSTGYMYLYREYLKGGKSAAEHAIEFKALSGKENIIKRIGGAAHEEGWRESFRAAGWPITKPRERDVEVGINHVYGWHKANKLFVFDDMLGYLDQKMSYSRKLDDAYEPTKTIQDKSKFHYMDAERYIFTDFREPEATYNPKFTQIYKITPNEQTEFDRGF